MNELMVVLTLTIIRFIIPFGLVMLIGSLVKRSRLSLK
jgi:hypothetical protein